MIDLPIYRRENGKLEAVPGNYAILDAAGFLPVETIRPASETYLNHLGVTDNFMEDTVNVGGTVTENAATHSKDMATGNAVNSYALWSGKTGKVLSTNILKLSCTIDNIVLGASITEKSTQIGLKGAWTTYLHGVFFWRFGGNTEFYGATFKDGSYSLTSSKITVVDGDYLTIVVTSTFVYFYVNGVLKGTITTNITTVALKPGFGLYQNAIVANAHSMSIDAMKYEI